MAKQTLKSLFGIDGDREQVELNLNPVNLSPTIRSGGNYNVAVQQTPLTNSALQLSDALKQGTQLYSQAVTLNRKRAETDVVTMSEEDFDKVVQEGLDKEGRSLFGYTKAYNQALAQKYYAEEIPKKLQNVSADLFKDPYKYKDATSFQAAAEDAATEIYNEADELLGNNVFAAKANNALKAATKSDFVTKQTDAFIRELPRITAKIQSDSAFRTFSELTDFDLAGAAIEGALTSAAGKMNNTDAADVVATAYFNEIDRAISDGETGRAEELLSQLNDDENGEGRRKFNGQEIFNTASRRIKIEDLEDKLEKEENKGLEQSKNTLVRAAADVRLSVVQEMGIDEDELAGQDLITTIQNEIATTGTATINGIKYDDPLVVAGLDETLRQMKVSTSLFKEQVAGQFTDQNAGERRAAVRQFKGLAFVGSISKSAQEMLYEEVQDPLGNFSKGFSAQGIAFESAFEAQLKIMEVTLAKSVLHLPRGEREAEYARYYNEKLRPSMQAFATDYLLGMVSDLEEPTETENKIFTKEMSEALAKEGYLPSEIKEIKEQTIQEALAEEESSAFVPTSKGERKLITLSDFTGSIERQDVYDSYNIATENDLFVDADEQLSSHGQIWYRHTNFRRRYGEANPPRQVMVNLYNRKPRFREQTLTEKLEKRNRVRRKLSVLGITANELAKNKIGAADKHIDISELFNNRVPNFGAFPIIYNDSLANTVEVVKQYMEDNDTYPPIFDSIAEQYNVSVNDIMTAQNQFLTQKKFIRN